MNHACGHCLCACPSPHCPHPTVNRPCCLPACLSPCPSTREPRAAHLQQAPRCCTHRGSSDSRQAGTPCHPAHWHALAQPPLRPVPPGVLHPPGSPPFLLCRPWGPLGAAGGWVLLGSLAWQSRKQQVPHAPCWHPCPPLPHCTPTQLAPHPHHAHRQVDAIMPGLLGRDRVIFASAYCNRRVVPLPGGCPGAWWCWAGGHLGAVGWPNPLCAHQGVHQVCAHGASFQEERPARLLVCWPGHVRAACTAPALRRCRL